MDVSERFLPSVEMTKWMVFQRSQGASDATFCNKLINYGYSGSRSILPAVAASPSARDGPGSLPKGRWICGPGISGCKEIVDRPVEHRGALDFGFEQRRDCPDLVAEDLPYLLHVLFLHPDPVADELDRVGPGLLALD